MALIKAYRWESHPARYPLFALGDIHWDSPACDRQAFKRCIENFRSFGENARAVLLGDAFDFLRKRDRDSLLSAMSKMSDEAREAIDRQHMREVKDFLSVAEPLKGKVFFLLEGNHSWIFSDGRTTGQVISEFLNADWADYCCHFNLILKTKGGDKGKPKRCTVPIYAHHGWGGPRTRTGDMGHFERGCMTDHDAILYLMGDSHDLYFTKARPRLALSKKGLHPIQCEISRWFGRTGGFLRGYVSGPKSSYIERRGRPPLSVGWIQMEIFFKQVGHNAGGEDRRVSIPYIRGDSVSF